MTGPQDTAAPAAPGTRDLERPAPRRPRHLLDPDDLHASHRRSIGDRQQLTRVQTWVTSVLAVSTIMHLAVGSAAVGVFAPADRMDARVGANIMAAVIGVLGVAVGFLIHRRSPVTPWLVLGIIPGVVGALVTFR